VYGTQVRLRLRRDDGRVVRQPQRVGEAELGPVVPAPQEVHVPEFGSRLRDGGAQAGVGGDVVGRVQAGEPFLVEAAERVDQRLGEHQTGRDPQPGGAGGVGQPYRGP
jgi:hypothetical protein